MRLNVIAVLLLVSIVSGCASTNQFVPKSADSHVPPEKVIIQITRPLQWYGFGNQIIVVANQQVVGHLGPLGELLWERDAGELHLQSFLKVLNMRDYEPITMKTKPGYRYTFRARLPFFYPISNSGLELISESRN